MKFALLLASVLGALPYTYKYEMASCPSGAVGSQCIAAQACSGNSCTGTAPTGATEGMLLGGVVGFRLTICAATGQTLSGAGNMQAYNYSSAEKLWVRSPQNDQPVTATGQCQTFADFLVGLSLDRVRFVASSVTVSTGDATHGLDVLLEGQPIGTGR